MLEDNVADRDLTVTGEGDHVVAFDTQNRRRVWATTIKKSLVGHHRKEDPITNTLVAFAPATANFQLQTPGGVLPLIVCD